jgi:hypothetical protein
MENLAERYLEIRSEWPRDELVIVFDIDDTILDLRHMIRHVLTLFDLRHATRYFDRLRVDHIVVGEMEVDRLMAHMGVPRKETKRIVDWFMAHAWTAPVVAHGHRAFPGAMEVIRWLQSQAGTHVGLNTGRPEVVRSETLSCLNTLGRAHEVSFDNDLLYMSRYGWGERTEESKVEGIRYFREKGYRIVAFVDNEPENLRAVAEHDPAGDILLLHAHTVFNSYMEVLPEQAVSGNQYDILALACGFGARDRLGRAA